MAHDDGKNPPSNETPAGDFRGPYGYGRPAHRADPNAKYGFQPNAMPLLRSPAPSVATQASETSERPPHTENDPPVNWPS